MLKSKQWLGLILAAITASSASARSYDDIIESNSIIISVYRDFKPFSSLDKQGHPQGIDIDIAQAIADKLKVKLSFQWMTADESVEDDLRNNLWKGHSLQRKIADLMLRVPYDRQYTQLRDDIGERVHDRVHMFAPYHTESWQIIFNSQKIEKIETMALFQYHSIGVEIDTVPDFYLTSAFNGRMRNHTHHFPTVELAIAAMKFSQVDAVMGLRSQVTASQSMLSDQFKLAKNAFPTLGKQQWDIGMAVKDEYRQLGYAVGDIIGQLVKSGKIKSIFTKHHTFYQQPQYYSDE